MACWIGVDDESKGHLVWHHCKITSEHNIQFLDGKPPQIEGDLEDSTDDTIEIEEPEENPTGTNNKCKYTDENNHEDEENDNPDSDTSDDEQPLLNKPKL